MKEPDWSEIPVPHGDQSGVLKRGDLVYVRKKTRGRFGPTMTIAQAGDYGIVISSWNSTMGSHKISLIKPDLTQVVTTATCCNFFGNIAQGSYVSHDSHNWPGIYSNWIEKTYVPIIIVRELRSRGKGFVASRDGRAILAKPLNSDSKIWLNQDKVHPEDWMMLQKSQLRCCSVRVPEWLANKSGAWGKSHVS